MYSNITKDRTAQINQAAQGSSQEKKFKSGKKLGKHSCTNTPIIHGKRRLRVGPEHLMVSQCGLMIKETLVSNQTRLNTVFMYLRKTSKYIRDKNLWFVKSLEFKSASVMESTLYYKAIYNKAQLIFYVISLNYSSS